MKRTKQMGISRLIRRRARGQSIPLIALVLVVIIAMVGLSVDVGNTFAEEREAVSASNSAAIAGMNAYLRNENASHGTVYEAIDESLRANGVDPANPSLTITRTFLDSKGQPVGDRPQVETGGASIDPATAYVQVRVTGTVDTYFARIVNRNTLPINATAYAGSCPSGQGVYPIAVWSQYLQGDAFANPGADIAGAPPTNYKANHGGDFEGYSSRRIYLKAQANVPGGFSYLQWTPSSGGNAGALADSLAGFGTLEDEFVEADWPAGHPNKPAVYPELPGELNSGDWVRSNTGLSNSSGVTAAIRGHIENQTQLVLPIFDEAVDGGQNGSYHIVELGLFVITAHDKYQGKDYFDLVYLGDATLQRTACNVTSPPSPETKTVFGNVTFEPEYGDAPSAYQPVQYLIVLDVSGSMNARFDGIGTDPTSGANIQCTNGPNGEKNFNCGIPSHAYKVKEERRVYVAKDALELLVELTNMPENTPVYKDNLPKDRMALVWFNDKSEPGWKVDFTSDASDLKDAIKTAGSVGGDPYKTSGGTNGAAGLYRAAQIFQNSPKQTDELGKTWDYKRVVIFITDGVSNQFLDTSVSSLNGGGSTASTFQNGSACEKLGASVAEDASCQTTEIGKKYKGKDRPVTEMINIAKNNIKENDRVESEIYVISLSNIPATGLENGVASSGNFFPASSLEVRNGETNVDRIIRQIRGETGNNLCTPVAGDEQGTISSNEFVNLPDYGLNYPIVGEVRLTSTDGVVTKAPIKAGTDGKLTYTFTDVARGTYTLEAFLFFKHATEEQQPRMYSWLYENAEKVGSISVTVSDGDASDGFGGQLNRDLLLLQTNPACAPSAPN
jgi:Flp pilus assembly protein TadG